MADNPIRRPVTDAQLSFPPMVPMTLRRPMLPFVVT